MEGKIVIVGAGHGGLVAARLLGRSGFTVELHERNSPGEVGYDWHDDVTPHVFERLQIPLPDRKCYFRKRDWSFITPDGRHTVRIHQDEERIDLSMERRPLVEMLMQRAAEHAAIFHDSPVEGLLIEGGRVQGVVVNGEEIRADLVIDSSGVNSILREQLPEGYMIQRHPREDELIHAYRAFYERRPGSEEPEHTNKAYLKHLGEQGISWCILDPSGQVNVLVGRIGKLDRPTLQRALQALRDDNAIIGDEVIRGGFTTAIPIRYPLSRMVGPGYAAVGDSAFMTIPLLGSGIAQSMTAGQILAEVIAGAGGDPFALENLWRYQVGVISAFGARNAGIDILKRWLLFADNGALSYLMAHNVVEEEDLKRVAVGELIELTPADLWRKLRAGYRKLGVLLKLQRVLMRTGQARRLALSIPGTYNRAAVEDWQNRLDRFIRR